MLYSDGEARVSAEAPGFALSMTHNSHSRASEEGHIDRPAESRQVSSTVLRGTRQMSRWFLFTRALFRSDVLKVDSRLSYKSLELKAILAKVKAIVSTKTAKTMKIG